MVHKDGRRNLLNIRNLGQVSPEDGIGVGVLGYGQSPRTILSFFRSVQL